jgi:hypothetical protein
MTPGSVFRWDRKEIYWQNYNKKDDGYLEEDVFYKLQSGYLVNQYRFYYTKDEALNDLEYAKHFLEITTKGYSS